ncbi:MULTISPECIES: glycoside hydrolase family 13 protein [Saccharibacillus]|uniref:glycoside hydrolase family 13 protein n=1 Tax=Saccharibacillus TaxID=456492 RepID=UPI00123A6A93|nr:alpha-glucosidase [Saccharibacillus sp. WB 17]MWJ31135.1 alpha,alpha-phosphotrehalase [Saccharibacillus sp. WB 17]
MERAFWKEAVVYQIYPRSFMDSNGDGVGDLQGIIMKLDYLKELGVDVIWLSPVYKSPNDDNGYDISDYEDIMDEFGTMADWEELLAGLHERGIKLMMDLVVNHTSDEHAWFVESRRDADGEYGDYYVWRDAAPDGGIPNNWESFFSGPVWEYDEQRGQYYLHLFSKKQPDLNWENEQVRTAVYDMMKFWLDKGVDGFRMDVINLISKVEGLPSNGMAPIADGSMYYVDGPRIHEFLQEMNREVLSKYDVMTVGEMPGVTVDEAKKYTAEERDELQMVFQFEHMRLDGGPGGKWDIVPWKLPQFKAVMDKWQVGLAEKGWNSLYLNNHDQPRMVSRFGNDGEYRVESAKLLATLLHTLRGTPYVYQGEELGMTNVKFPMIDDYKDIESLNMYSERVTHGGADPGTVMEAIQTRGRDNARTPVQWDDSDYAGFTTGTPWIGVNPNYKTINAKQQLADPDSVFHYYKKLIALRKQHDIMTYGEYQLLLPDHETLYAYTRTLGDETWLIVLNFSTEPTSFDWPAHLPNREASLIVGNYGEDGLDHKQLRPYEARVYGLK